MAALTSTEEAGAAMAAVTSTEEAGARWPQ